MKHDTLHAGTEWGTVPEVLRIRGKAMGEKQNKRELILAAAQDVFFEKGYHNATSEEIAKRAGVGKGTLYQYFDSKLDIFIEMHQLYIKQYTASMSELIDDHASFQENLRRIVQFHITHMQELNRFAVRMTVDMPTEITGEKEKQIVNNVQNSVKHVLERLIDNGKRRGEIRDIDSRLIIGYLMGNFFGIAHLIREVDIDQAQKAQLEEEVMQTVLYGLATNTDQRVPYETKQEA